MDSEICFPFFCFPDCDLLQGKKENLGVRAAMDLKSKYSFHMLYLSNHSRKLLPEKYTYLLNFAILKSVLTKARCSNRESKLRSPEVGG